MKTTIYDIAKLAGVTAATVSNVINERGRVSEKTKKKVFDIMNELGYVPNTAAAALKGKATYTIGFFIPDVLNPIYMEYLKHAEAHAQELGFSIMMCSTENNPEKERRQAEVLRQKNVDGFIITSKFQNKGLLKEWEESGYPVVFIGHERLDFEFDSFAGNDYEAGRLAADHLLSLGHRRIALLMEKNSVSSEKRLLGFQHELAYKGADLSPIYLLENETTIERSEQMATILLTAKERPTAVFGGNDVIAVGVLQAAGKLGIAVPNQLSVVGIDDTFLCKIVNPNLTSIAMPVKEISRLSVEGLVNKIKGLQSRKQSKIFKPKLIRRNSTDRISQ